VERLDLSALYAEIRAVEGHAGRAAIDPKLLTALWRYATLDGVGSARRLERLCAEHAAYQWLCGGVTLNYHTLSDFRVAHGAVLDDLLTQSVAVLRQSKVVDCARVAQDGLRVRAHAGSGSFHREPTLKEHLEQARQEVQELKRDLAAEGQTERSRREAARLRGARERETRVAEALRQLEEVRAVKQPAEKEEARVSTTDPEARVLKLPGGGFRPGYNLQFATTTQGQVVVGVGVTNIGSDRGQWAPMLEQVKQRCGQTPSAWLADGDFAKGSDLEQVSPPAGTTQVYMPVRRPKDRARDGHVPLPEDTPAVAAWKQRMGTPEAQAIYRERAATAECVNAQARNRELEQVTVRGSRKVLSIALWFALAHNLMRALALGVLNTVGGG
jgi:transposase